MASRITALDWESYKNRDAIDPTLSRRVDGKPLENEEDRFQASFDINRGSRDGDGYAGNDDQQPLPERVSIVAMVKSNPLTVAHINGRMSDEVATRTAHQYYSGILQAGGPRALNLIRAAAAEGNKAVQNARAMGNGEDFAVVASHKGAANVAAGLINAALEMYPASREDAAKRSQNYNTGLEEHKLRQGDISLEQSVQATLARAQKEGWGNREGIQKLPANPAEVDFARAETIMNARALPKPQLRLHPEAVSKLLHPAHLVRDTNEESETFGRVVGLSDAVKGRVREAYHKAIVDHANSPARAGSMAVPPHAILSTDLPRSRTAMPEVGRDGTVNDGKAQGVALSTKSISRSIALFADPAALAGARDTLANAKADEEIVIGSMAKDLGQVQTQARISNVANPKASTYAYEQHGFSKDAARYLVNGMQAIDHASTTEFHLGGKPNPLNVFLIGHAAARGNIGMVAIGDEVLSLSQAQALGATEYLSPAQMVRRGLSQGMQAHASEPAAAVALSLMRGENGKMSNADIRALQTTDMDVLDMVEAAKDPHKAREMATEHRVSLSGLNVLKTADTAFVGTNLPHVTQELSGKGLALLGQADYPSSLRGQANAPAFLTLSGDADGFRNTHGAIGIIGTPLRSDNKDDVKMAAAIAPQMAALRESGRPLMWVDGQTPFPIEPRKGDIVFMSGGLGVFNNAAEEEAQKVRDMAGAYTASDMVPSYTEYKAPKGRGKNAKGTQEIYKNTPHDSHAVSAATLLGMMADRLVVTNGNTHEHGPAKAAVVEQLKQGKRIMVVEPPASATNALTSALLRADGVKALRDAGFGASTTEDPALQAVKGGPVAMTLNPRDPQSAAKAVADLAQGKLPQPKAAKQATKSQEDQR